MMPCKSEACHALVQYLRNDSVWTVATAACWTPSEEAALVRQLGAWLGAQVACGEMLQLALSVTD